MYMEVKIELFLTDQRITCRLREGGDIELNWQRSKLQIKPNSFLWGKGTVVKVFQARRREVGSIGAPIRARNLRKRTHTDYPNPPEIKNIHDLYRQTHVQAHLQYGSLQKKQVW